MSLCVFKNICNNAEIVTHPDDKDQSLRTNRQSRTNPSSAIAVKKKFRRRARVRENDFFRSMASRLFLAERKLSLPGTSFGRVNYARTMGVRWLKLQPRNWKDIAKASGAVMHKQGRACASLGSGSGFCKAKPTAMRLQSSRDRRSGWSPCALRRGDSPSVSPVFAA